MRPVGNFENVLAAARDWVGREHAKKNQLWSVGRPYLDHLNAVEGVLLRFGFSDPTDPIHQNLRLAALAHDLLEDTEVSPVTIRVLLGPDVLTLVEAVTDSPGKNRAVRHALTYPRIVATPWATVLKLADRVANLEESLRTQSHLAAMYAGEAEAFREALYRPGGPEAVLWEHLESLLGSEPPVEPIRELAQPPAVPLQAIAPTPWF